MTDRVVIAAFRERQEAEAARGALNEEGIGAEVTATAPAARRLCDDLFGDGFDVVVDAGDAASAIAILHRLWPDAPPPPAMLPERCPACGSPDVAALRRVRFFVVAAAVLVAGGLLTGQRELFFLLIGIIGVLLVFAPARRCRMCGERWTPPERNTPPEAAAAESVAAICPRCGSGETERIPRRREKAWTLLVNLAIPPALLVWPLLPRQRCGACGHEWR